MRSTTTAKHMAESTSPIRMIRPKMVEIQLGSSDMIQSMAAKEIVNPYRIRPGPLTALKRPLLSGAPGLSVSLDHIESRKERTFHTAKEKTARMMKPLTVR